MLALSPFKTEKTPSFTVNDEKEFYHCFATSEHGNIFDFVMKTQNLKFGEAVKSLAQSCWDADHTHFQNKMKKERKIGKNILQFITNMSNFIMMKF